MILVFGLLMVFLLLHNELRVSRHGALRALHMPSLHKMWMSARTTTNDVHDRKYRNSLPEKNHLRTHTALKCWLKK